MHTAQVYVRNLFDAPMRVQVLHQYTGYEVEDSGWNIVQPGFELHVMDVKYETGLLSVGRDHWIINATELSVLSGKTGVGPFTLNGQVMFGIKRYQSGRDFLSQWIQHTLHETDVDAPTYIELRPSMVDFVSPSGTTRTTFDLDFIPHLA